MSDTIIDLPKVAQMLDNGWRVRLWKTRGDWYTAEGRHDSHRVWERARDCMRTTMESAGWSSEQAAVLLNADFCEPGVIDTEDMTPEQALTRLAYKVHGEVI